MKPRKLKYKTHKDFGTESRIITEADVKAGHTGGRGAGSKQILPGDYGHRQTGKPDNRSRAEKRNADDRRDWYYYYESV